MCVCFKRVGEISGLLRAWGGLVGRNGADVGTRWDVRGVGWGMAGNGWRGKVTLFSGYRARMGSSEGKGVRPGWALGRPWDIGKAIRQTQGDGAAGFRVGRVDSPFARETVLGAPGNLKQAPAAADTSNEDWGHAILSRHGNVICSNVGT